MIRNQFVKISEIRVKTTERFGKVKLNVTAK